MSAAGCSMSGQRGFGQKSISSLSRISYRRDDLCRFQVPEPLFRSRDLTHIQPGFHCDNPKGCVYMVTDPDIAAVGKLSPPFKTPSPTRVARIRTEGLSMGQSCCLNFPAFWTSSRPISIQLTTGWTSRTGDSQSRRPQTSKCKLKEICVGPWAHSSSLMFYSFRSSL